MWTGDSFGGRGWFGVWVWRGCFESEFWGVGMEFGLGRDHNGLEVVFLRGILSTLVQNGLEAVLHLASCCGGDPLGNTNVSA